jgi:hypothetical protein
MNYRTFVQRHRLIYYLRGQQQSYGFGGIYQFLVSSPGKNFIKSNFIKSFVLEIKLSECLGRSAESKKSPSRSALCLDLYPKPHTSIVKDVNPRN